MNRLIKAALNRGIFIVTSILIILVWGGFSAFQMQRDYLPPIQNPTLMISVHAPDFQADQIKAAVTGPIEQAVRKIDGIETLETNSFAGGSLMSLYFPMNYDMNRAERDVTFALDHAAMPAGAEKPVVTRVSTSSFPIMRLSLTSPTGKVDDDTLRTVTQAQIARELKALPGVSDLRITGAGSGGYVLTVRMADLGKAGLTLEDVTRSLKGADLSGVQGKITNSQVSIPLRLPALS
ncbi:efflux RND transporter permease subunit [Paenibacillus sp. P25]|nr:efflux RND transporter permease subunit [Paenibacillus sp. P25]